MALEGWPEESLSLSVVLSSSDGALPGCPPVRGKARAQRGGAYLQACRQNPGIDLTNRFRSDPEEETWKIAS